MSQQINVNLDEKQFGIITLPQAATLSQLRTKLVKNYELRSNSFFLNDQDYPIAREDEDKVTTASLLMERRVIQMTTIEINWKDREPSSNSDGRTRRKTAVDEVGNSLLREFLSIVKWFWHLALKPVIIIVLVSIFFYYGYTKGLCHYGRSLPLVTMYCPIDPSVSMSLPPVSELAEKSASLADSLINADVSAPMRFVQAKISLIQLRNQVIHSDIDTSVRDKLSGQMSELEKLTQTGVDQLTIMLTSFGGALDKVRLYTQFALEDISKVMQKEIRSGNAPLQIGKTKKVLFSPMLGVFIVVDLVQQVL